MAALNEMQEALQRKGQDSPDEERMFLDGKGSLKIYKVGGAIIGRGTFEPGWRWSQHVKPMVGTDSCQAEHTGLMLAGTLCVRMDDGEEVEYHAGDSFYMRPGHDAWVVGDTRCELLDFSGATHYAEPHAQAQSMASAGNEQTEQAEQAEQNRQTVMQGYEDFSRGDIEALLSRYTDDVEWVGYDSAIIPFAGSYHGKEGVRQFFQSLGGAMQALNFEPGQAICEGDRVAVLGHGMWKLSNGQQVDSDWCHVFELRDGKICRFQDFDDTGQFSEAFGMDAGAMLSRTQQQGQAPLHS
jgi:ketosteroid isomerase-like protein/quercetin dioxygenase-like cupin family protein